MSGETSEKLTILIESKREKIIALRSDLKLLVDEVRTLEAEVNHLKKEASSAKASEEIADAVRNFSGIWAKVAASGLNIKQVKALQNPDITAKCLGLMLGVSAGRARQIRQIAYRKMRHRERIEMVSELGDRVYREVCGEERNQ